MSAWDAGGDGSWGAGGGAGVTNAASSSWDDGNKADNGGGRGFNAFDDGAGDSFNDNGGDGPQGGDGGDRACYNCGEPGYVHLRLFGSFESS